LPEDHFREPLPLGPVVIDARKTEVFDRIGDKRASLRHGVGRTHRAALHGIEERAQPVGESGRRMFLIFQGFSFDSAESASIELTIVRRLGHLIL
jgi:hypothetical protein